MGLLHHQVTLMMKESLWCYSLALFQVAVEGGASDAEDLGDL